ncbi:molybdopterin synthase [Halorubrum yunnanense]|uniref:Molybdopterin synthase n=1 Tax=Halorubrum yunnanense TaxID=1526162 RepID=A0ABD5YDZ5_9EURY|nr:molybdopterin synthase [Halorubrum yunnanense]
MQPIAIAGPGAADLAAALTDRIDGRTAVVNRANGDLGGDTGEAEATDGGVAVGAPADQTDADTRVTLGEDGRWTGRGSADGLDAFLDGLAPDHDFLVAVGDSRLRVPTVLLGADAEAEDVPGTVIAAADAPEALDLDRLVADLDAADPWITRETLVRRVERSAGADRAGAIATFTGRVRAQDAPDDDRTTHLAFEKYEGVAAERMDAIGTELTERDGVFDVRMHHRTGVIEADEDIVFVVVLAGHRREAFRAVEDGIDRLKDEVPIFKKEATEAEEFWVHRRD